MMMAGPEEFAKPYADASILPSTTALIHQARWVISGRQKMEDIRISPSPGLCAERLAGKYAARVDRLIDHRGPGPIFHFGHPQLFPHGSSRLTHLPQQIVVAIVTAYRIKRQMMFDDAVAPPA